MVSLTYLLNYKYMPVGRVFFEDLIFQLGGSQVFEVDVEEICQCKLTMPGSVFSTKLARSTMSAFIWLILALTPEMVYDWLVLVFLTSATLSGLV